MGYKTDGLTFNTLREANLVRLPLFKNNLGNPAHSHPEGKDWSINDWTTAVLGELGEFANVAKKYRRGDITKEEFIKYASEELPDVQIYLDILAFQCGINLGNATIEKFNKTSRKIKANIFLAVDDWYRYDPEIKK